MSKPLSPHPGTDKFIELSTAVGPAGQKKITWLSVVKEEVGRSREQLPDIYINEDVLPTNEY